RARIAADSPGWRGRDASEAGASPVDGGHWPRPLRSLRSLAEWLWWRDLPPLRSSFSAPLAVGMALLVTALLVENGSGNGLAALYRAMPRARPAFLVRADFGDAPTVWPQTTSELAGRVFVLSDD